MDSYHYGEVFIVDAVVIDWRLKEMPILLEPGSSNRLVIIAFPSPLLLQYWMEMLTTWEG